jgi:hypothetical protein
MPGLHRNLKSGPSTGVVSAAVVGGQLVEADPSNVGYVRPASAASITVLGVAYGDAQAAGSDPGVGGNTGPLNIGWPHPEVAIEYGPADVDVVYSVAAHYGDLLLAAANGQVAPVADGVTPAAGSFVGRCTQPTGVATGAVGSMRLFG